MLEKQDIAAVSYDSQETLDRFTAKYQIGFSLLSDRDSVVIVSEQYRIIFRFEEGDAHEVVCEDYH